MRYTLLRLLLIWLCGGPNSVGAAPLSNDNITQDELVRRTQEMFDAVASGNSGPWSRNFADDALYFDEKGRSMDKPALISDLTPLPKGYEGKITVTHVISRIQPQVAVLSYDLDEVEVVFGQKLRARYHGTDTWLLRKGIWQIVAGQMFRYFEDPAEGVAHPEKFPDYCGTYALAPGVTRDVKCTGNQVLLTSGKRPAKQLIPESPDLFFRRGVEGRILFHRDSQGKVDSFIDRRNNEDLLWKKQQQ